MTSLNDQSAFEMLKIFLATVKDIKSESEFFDMITRVEKFVKICAPDEDNQPDSFASQLLSICVEDCLSLVKKKSHDYGGGNANDIKQRIGNLLDFGWPGVVIRLGDKYHRLRAFLKQGEFKVKDETVDDTLRDMVNYGLICLFMRKFRLGDNRPFVNVPDESES